LYPYMYGEMAWRLLFVLMFIVICPCALEVIAPIIANMIITLRILIIVSPIDRNYEWSRRSVELATTIFPPEICSHARKRHDWR
jgi:hypothetical protein